MMTAEQLKGSILQLAMQGKLVEQRPEEGTGEELYKEIQIEKKKLLKEGMLKKQKPLSEIKEEDIPFDIPGSWRWVKLGDISSYAQPKEKVSPKDITSEMWSLDLEDIEKGTGKVLNRVLAKERKIQGDKVLFKKGNILYSKLRPYLLKILIADNEGITTPELVPFSIYGIKNSGFFLWYLRSPYVDNAVNSVSYGVKMPRVGTDTMVNLLVPLPPLAEQKRIVAKIEELMPFVEKYAAASTKLNMLNAAFPEMMKKSILQEAVQGKLVPQDPNDEPASLLLKKIAEEKKLIKEGKIKKQKPLPEITEDEIPFDIPESWVWVRFAQVVSIESNLVKPEEHQEKLQIAPDCIGKGNGILLQKRTVKESGVKSPNHLFFKGQIIYSKIRPALRKAVEAPSDGLCSADMYPLSTIMDNHYILYYILSDTFTNAVTANANRVKMPKVNQEELNNVLIPVPPLSEQKRIAKRLDILIPQLSNLFEKTHN